MEKVGDTLASRGSTGRDLCDRLMWVECDDSLVPSPSFDSGSRLSQRLTRLVSLSPLTARRKRAAMGSSGR